MHRTTFYDHISLVCLMIGGGLLLAALFCVLSREYLDAAAFAGAAVPAWHFSSQFARFAIASSGRQK